MINKKVSFFLFTTFAVFTHCSSWAQAGYAIFGSPTSTGCSGSGICQVEATPFSSILTAAGPGAPITLTNATQMYFTSEYNPDMETYIVSMIINLDALRINQPDQVQNFQNPPGGGPAQRMYVIPNDVFIAANVIGGALRADYLNGFMRVQAGSQIPFTPATPLDHFVKLVLTSASGIRGSQHAVVGIPAPTTGNVAFDIQFNSTNKTTFYKDKNKHKHRHRRHHKRAAKAERRWEKRLL